MLGNLEVSRLLVDGLAARLREAYSKIESLAFLGVHARVVEALLECATSVDGSGIVDRGSEEVARRVAASREMVSRVLKSMREQGLIRRHKRRTIIVDPDRPARDRRRAVVAMSRLGYPTRRYRMEHRLQQKQTRTLASLDPRQ